MGSSVFRRIFGAGGPDKISVARRYVDDLEAENNKHRRHATEYDAHIRRLREENTQLRDRISNMRSTAELVIARLFRLPPALADAFGDTNVSYGTPVSNDTVRFEFTSPGAEESWLTVEINPITGALRVIDTSGVQREKTLNLDAETESILHELLLFAALARRPDGKTLDQLVEAVKGMFTAGTNPVPVQRTAAEQAEPRETIV